MNFLKTLCEHEVQMQAQLNELKSTFGTLFRQNQNVKMEVTKLNEHIQQARCKQIEANAKLDAAKDDCNAFSEQVANNEGKQNEFMNVYNEFLREKTAATNTTLKEMKAFDSSQVHKYVQERYEQYQELYSTQIKLNKELNEERVLIEEEGGTLDEKKQECSMNYEMLASILEKNLDPEVKYLELEDSEKQLIELNLKTLALEKQLEFLSRSN